ncbi:T9SS type B sorting domain-containing protein [Flavobacterium restrictum]|uniref:T9SS type B sorting domain-containing protein n=1 Tax=Flavobacterium restrictum TaxID=2594428 RepID=A0A553E8H8_9FLAO|nr:T9SS type B sorting domain-containing protein [Flavobacterium restrictum]TRX41337.1 T9SS type B sorting domain-containing protein [Flavobacterium restrictum]
MKKIAYLYFILLSSTCFSQFSKTHYIPPIVASAGLAEDHYLYVSTPSTKVVNFKIIAIGGTVSTHTVSNTTPFIYSIGQGDDTQLCTPNATNGIVKNKGYIIEAEDLVYVSVRINAGLNDNGSYNHAGGLVSKGNSALGNSFRLGAMLNPLYDTTLLNFASILSTENGTKVTISNIPDGTILSDGTLVNGPIKVTLNKNESFVLALKNYLNTGTLSNSAKMIGALVETDKPVVVNSGSFCGSNSTVTRIDEDGFTSPTGRDVGFDQIVPFERTGKEYIFVKGIGTDELERVLLIANVDQTQLFANGSTTPFATLNKGEYKVIDGSFFDNGNLYITSTQNVFAYQSIAGTITPANQNMFFVPPINCSTPRIVDNIPEIQSVGNVVFSGGLNIVTETGATVTINNNPISSSPIPITGNPNFVRYTINNLSGNIAVKSTKQVYVSYFGTNGAATYGGYYSGFDLKPEIVTDKISVGASSCIPNIVLKISSLSAYDSFQWYQNDVIIPSATQSTYTPTASGYYQVKGSISGCVSDVFSDKIPVSDCPLDTDTDGTNNNIDIDLDNDGILNSMEAEITSLNQSNTITGTNYTGTISGTGSIIGKPTYGFVSEVPAGKSENVSYALQFNEPKTIRFSYLPLDATQTTNPSEYTNADGDFILRVPKDKTLTILDPLNELLIDTNYDGIYESGVTEFSSFEIRFRVKSTLPLVPGASQFSISSYLTDSVTFVHHNLSDTTANKAIFMISTTNLVHSDLDAIPDVLDIDSDNDGIPDTMEAQGKISHVFSGTDTNKNGLDDAFEPGLTPINTDSDAFNGVLKTDNRDLDSDNDGIYDVTESGSSAMDSNSDGIIDGLLNAFGTNGLFDSLETSPDSGILKTPIVDTDADGRFNYLDLDSDNDLCNDVIEAGFLDPNFDGYLGNNPVIIDTNGVVTSTNGYTTPNGNYILGAPITITTQPQNQLNCWNQSATFTIATNADVFEWQVSSDGINWNVLTNDATYTGVNTAQVSLTVTAAMEGYRYRVLLHRTGNSCEKFSDFATLHTLSLPIVAPQITLKQCDDDSDGISDFNLTEKNDFISVNYELEKFSYFETFAGANANDSTTKIPTPTAYRTSSRTIWVRIENANGCFTTSELQLVVSATQINSSFQRSFTVCDDYVDASNTDRDGIATFDFSNVIADIQNKLPAPSSNYIIKYYRNQINALAEIDPISNISSYRNVGYPNQQKIWVRVDSTIGNACFGLGDFITLTVENLPIAHTIPDYVACDDSSNDGIFGFDTSNLETQLVQGQNAIVTYLDEKNNPLPSPFPSTFATRSQTIKARITNASTNTTNGIACYDETTIRFTVTAHPIAHPVVIPAACDDESPSDTDGSNRFDTTTIQNDILKGQSGMTVTYLDANGKPLSSPLPNPFVTATQNVTAIVTNLVNTVCPEQTILQFIVNPLPNIDINLTGDDDKLVCSNLPTFFVQLDAGILDGSPTSNFTYTWKKDEILLPNETDATLQVNTKGIYTVTVNTFLGCSRTRTIVVTASDIAKIDSLTIVDLTAVNSVTVNVSGKGDYSYSLDERTGPFQVSNFFDNVAAGIHEVFIYDKNGCGTISQVIAVVGVPKYFTPNGDGFNDYWTVKGVNADFNSNSIIYIFDRYGKLIAKIPTNSQGWDGTSNGNPLPGDDYWYTVQLEDGREAKGHFSLKR